MSLVERRPSRSLSSSGHTCKSHAPLVSRFPVSIQILPCGTGFWAIWNAAEISHFRKLLHLSMPWQREGIYHSGNVKLTPLASAPSFERTVISPLLCLWESSCFWTTSGGGNSGINRSAATTAFCGLDSTPGRRAVFCSLANHFKATGGSAMLKEVRNGTQHNTKWKPCVLILR